MKKGVVLKIKKDKAIIMAEDCSFIEIKSFNGMYQGMEVCFKEEDILKKKAVFRSNKYINAACFMLLVFSSYLLLSFYQENIAAYAYVGIDINPSIEIALNKKGRIINARGLDEEGKEILEEVDVEKMDSVDGVKAIITKTIEKNYLEDGNTNDITVYAIMDQKDSKKGNQLVEKVEKAIKEEVVAHSIEGNIKTFVSDKKVKKEADKKGISVAKYISQAEKEAVSIKAEDRDKKENKELRDNDKGRDDKEKKKLKYSYKDKADKEKEEKENIKNNDKKKYNEDNDYKKNNNWIKKYEKNSKENNDEKITGKNEKPANNKKDNNKDKKDNDEDDEDDDEGKDKDDMKDNKKEKQKKDNDNRNNNNKNKKDDKNKWKNK